MKWKAYSKYKDSGIEWLGDIPDDWCSKKLKYVGKAILGLTYQPSDVVDGSQGRLVLRSSNIQNGHIALIDNTYVKTEIPEKLITRLGDILICSRNGSRALIGKNAVITKNVVGSTFGAFMTVFRSEFSNYLHYIFNSHLFEYQSGAFQTSTINQLTVDVLNNFKIPIPSLETQQKISTFLDRESECIDNLIAKKQRQIELLQEKRLVLISHTVTKGLNPNVKMKDSGVDLLGEIPEHWNISRLKYVCSVVGRIGFRGYTCEDQVDAGEGALALGASHITDIGNIDITSPVYISWNKYYESPEIMVDKGDLLVVQRGSCGRVGFVEDELGPATINPSIVLLKKVEIPPKYLFYYLRGHLMKNILDSLLSSTAVPMLSQFQIENLLLCLPSKDEMIEISEYLNHETKKIQRLIDRIQLSINMLQEYRTALISAAVTGKVDVQQEVNDD